MSDDQHVWRINNQDETINLTVDNFCLFYSSEVNQSDISLLDNYQLKVWQVGWGKGQLWIIYTTENRNAICLPFSGQYCVQSIFPLCELLAFFDESNSQLPELQVQDCHFEALPRDEKELKPWFTLAFLLYRADQQFLQWCDCIRKKEAYWLVRYLLPHRSTSEKVLCLSQSYGFSYSYFRRVTTHCLGMTAKKKLLSWRISQTVLDIIDGQERITDIALQNGFASSSHASTLVKQKLAIKPFSIRKANKNKK